MASALERVVAVYSSHPSAPLSLAARVTSIEPVSFRALEESRAALRIPAMRGSIHLVPAQTASLLVAATQIPAAERRRRFRVAGISEESYDEIRERVLAFARVPVTVAQVREATGLGENAGTVLRILALDGLLLRVGSGSLRSNSLTYVSTEAWRGEPFAEVDRDRAIRWLAHSYLAAFGPARVEDFGWWAALPVGSARSILADIPTVDVGDGLLLLEEEADEFAAIEPLPRDSLDVLPVWDAYTMGYAADGRGRFASSEHVDRLYDDMGNGLGVVLAGGQAVAAWGSRFAGKRLEVSLDRFERLRGPLQAALEQRFHEIAVLLGGSEATVADALEPLRPLGGKGRRSRYGT